MDIYIKTKQLKERRPNMKGKINMLKSKNTKALSKITLTGLLIFNCISIQAQWNKLPLDSNYSNVEWTGLHFFNNDTGVIAGYDYNLINGIIIRTIDGGNTWKKVHSFPQVFYNNLFFNGNDTGFAVGSLGKISVTLDGGLSWNDTLAVTNQTNVEFTALSIKSGSGYLVGTAGIIMKSVNNGFDWTTLFKDTTGNYNYTAVDFVDAYTGYITGNVLSKNAGIILKTIDGGATWDTTYFGTQYEVLTLQAFSSDVVYVNTPYYLYKSLDGGNSWSYFVIDKKAVQIYLQSFYFIDEMNGYVFTSPDFVASTVYKTIDGGVSWYSQSVDTVDNFYEFQMTNNLTGYAIGQYGQIVKTINGGGGGCPVTDFKVDKKFDCSGPEYAFYFTSMSADSIYGDTLEYSWAFGDNGYSIDKNPLHSYRFDSLNKSYIDSFEVTLTVHNPIGCATTHKDTVVISNDCVWPGDADDDEISYFKDLLAIGLQYDGTGIPREDKTTDWSGKLALSWSDTLSNGANVKHADCNGDGIIDKNDIPSILDNYDEIHTSGKTNRTNSTAAPDLYFEFSSDTILMGDTVTAFIKLGKGGNEALDVYGVAFRIRFNASFVDSSTLKVNFDNSWLGKRDSDMVAIYRNVYSKNAVDVALTRIDHKAKDGDGELGALTFVTIDNISGGIFELNFEDNILIDTDAVLIPHNPIQDTAIIINSLLDLVDNKNKFNIFPNPANNTILIDASNLKVSEITLYNILGKKVYTYKTNPMKTYEIDISDIPSGSYMLSLQTSDGEVFQRVDVIQ